MTRPVPQIIIDIKGAVMADPIPTPDVLAVLTSKPMTRRQICDALDVDPKTPVTAALRELMSVGEVVKVEAPTPTFRLRTEADQGPVIAAPKRAKPKPKPKPRRKASKASPDDDAMRAYLAEPRTVREVADYLQVSHPTARKRIIAASALKVTGTRPAQWVLNSIEAVAREARIAAEGQGMPAVGEVLARDGCDCDANGCLGDDDSTDERDGEVLKGACVDGVALHADGTLGVSGHIAKPTPTALAATVDPLTALAEAHGINADGMTFEQVVEVAARRLHMAREGQTAAQELNATLRKKVTQDAEVIEKSRRILLEAVGGDGDVSLLGLAGDAARGILHYEGLLKQIGEILGSESANRDELPRLLRKKLDDASADIARMRGDLEAMREHLGQGADVELGALPGLLRARLVADAAQYEHVRRLLAQERSKANDRQDDLAGLQSTTSATVDRIKEMTGQDTLGAALDHLRGMKCMAHGFEQVRDVLFRGWPPSVERAGYSVQRTTQQAETMVALAQGLDRIRDALFPMSGGVHVDTVVAKVVALAGRPEAGDETMQRLVDMEQRNRRLEARVRGLLKMIETIAECAAGEERSA